MDGPPAGGTDAGILSGNRPRERTHGSTFDYLQKTVVAFRNSVLPRLERRGFAQGQTVTIQVQVQVEGQRATLAHADDRMGETSLRGRIDDRVCGTAREVAGTPAAAVVSRTSAAPQP